MNISAPGIPTRRVVDSG